MTLAVVIPTLNAARDLPASIAALRGNPDEVVVADGGSTDDTVSVAGKLGARAVIAPRGRGAQLAAGVVAARGDWLLLLHADTRLDPAWAEAAQGHMRSRPDAAGYFRFALDTEDPRARRLERLVAWRCRVLALPYGDQGLLLPRALLDAAGGIRPLPLMEDVDLVPAAGAAAARAARCGGDHLGGAVGARWVVPAVGAQSLLPDAVRGRGAAAADRADLFVRTRSSSSRACPGWAR